MKKIFLLFLLLWQIYPQDIFAQTIVTNKKEERLTIINATSFPDYFPISYRTQNGNYSSLLTIFAPALEQMAEAENFKIEYILKNKYSDAVENVRRGDIDILLGMYYATKQYSGLEYIFPAVLDNPVYIIMLPQNISRVSKPEDLKQLRGIYIAKEYFSDYMQSNFKNYNMQPAETPLQAYEKLFTGEADYIAGGYYYNYVEICRLGLKDYVSFSKSPLWKMPMFIGISKASEHHQKVGKALKKYAAQADFRQLIGDMLKEWVQKTERESQGVVPPMFVKKASAEEKTPADEAAQAMEEKQQNK